MASPPEIRLLQRGEEPALEAFLVPRTETSMFLRSNWRGGVGLVDEGKPFQGKYLAAVEGGAIVAVLAHYWQGNIVLQAPRYLPELLAALPSVSSRAVAGLVGPWAQVEQARRLLGLQAAPCTLENKEVLFSLSLQELKVPPVLVRGEVSCRRARVEEVERLAPQRHDYMVEAIGEAPGDSLLARARELLEISARAGHLFVLEKGGEPVATCGFNAALPDIVQIGGVFTPVPVRGRGYGRAVVAGALRLVRAEGVQKSVLFTGHDNPAAQQAYRAIGYQATGDYGLALFREGQPLRLPAASAAPVR